MPNSEDELRAYAKTLIYFKKPPRSFDDMFFDELFDLKAYVKTLHYSEKPFRKPPKPFDDEFLDTLFNHLGSLITTPQQLESVIGTAYYYRVGRDGRHIKAVKNELKAETRRLRERVKKLRERFIDSDEIVRLLDKMIANPYNFFKPPVRLPEYEFTLQSSIDNIYNTLYPTTRLTKIDDTVKIRHNKIEALLKTLK